jgi:hypothetical protein
MNGVKWSPKIDPYKVVALYRKFMDGQADMADVDDVGIGLHLRVKSILLVAEWRLVCPECGREFQVSSSEPATNCPGPGCSFSIPREKYLASWRHRDLWRGKALPAFEEYYARYPVARTIGEKMVLIDTLVHSFHFDLVENLPNRCAANNLMEGSLKQVVDILDRLSGIQPENDRVFRETVDLMWRRRRGQLEPKGKPRP